MNNKQQDDPRAGHQSDLAEGERDTVEESIRIHEQKGDLDTEDPEDEKDGA
jgi:hypothetical protein